MPPVVFLCLPSLLIRKKRKDKRMADASRRPSLHLPSLQLGSACCASSSGCDSSALGDISGASSSRLTEGSVDVTDGAERRTAIATHIRPSHERKAGKLCVVLLRANGLAAADKRGTSDPYAKLIVRSGDKERSKKTKASKQLQLVKVVADVHAPADIDDKKSK